MSRESKYRITALVSAEACADDGQLAIMSRDVGDEAVKAIKALGSCPRGVEIVAWVRRIDEKEAT